jgi:hypothetical protein
VTEKRGTGLPPHRPQRRSGSSHPREGAQPVRRPRRPRTQATQATARGPGPGDDYRRIRTPRSSTRQTPPPRHPRPPGRNLNRRRREPHAASPDESPPQRRPSLLPKTTWRPAESSPRPSTCQRPFSAVSSSTAGQPAAEPTPQWCLRPSPPYVTNYRRSWTNPVSPRLPAWAATCSPLTQPRCAMQGWARSRSRSAPPTHSCACSTNSPLNWDSRAALPGSPQYSTCSSPADAKDLVPPREGRGAATPENVRARGDFPSDAAPAITP